jgi:hypothetical protein
LKIRRKIQGRPTSGAEALFADITVRRLSALQKTFCVTPEKRGPVPLKTTVAEINGGQNNHSNGSYSNYY